MSNIIWERVKRNLSYLFKGKFKNDDTFIMLALTVFPLALPLSMAPLFLLFMKPNNPLYPLVVLAIFVAIGLWALIIWLVDLSFRKQDAEEVKQEEIRKKVEETMANGTWDFPSLEFVKQCVFEGLEDLDSDLASMKKIAKEILSENGVPAEYHNKYCSKPKIKKYFDENYYSPQKTEPRNIKVCHMINGVSGVYVTERFLYSLKFLQGKAKREYMLKYFLGRLSKEHASNLESMANFNTYYHKTKASNINPAIAGGLASAIGGVGAGVYAAGKMMEENWKSEQQASTYSTLAAFSGQQAAYAKCAVEKFEKELNALKRKRVYKEYSTEQIFDEFDIETKFKLEDRGIYMHITIHGSYAFPGVVDGSFSAYVYMKDKLVYEYVIPFGIFGHESGLVGNDDDYSIKNNRGLYVIPITFLGENREKDIRIEIKPNNLWIMSE